MRSPRRRRSASSAGWQVAAPPAVIGPDGQPQSDWISKRPEGFDRNLSFVNVTGVSSDAAAIALADCVPEAMTHLPHGQSQTLYERTLGDCVFGRSAAFGSAALANALSW